MAVRLKSRFPGGNGRFLGLDSSGPDPELCFAPEPHGCAEALWFNLRVEDDAPPSPVPQHVRITIPFIDNILCGTSPLGIRPVYHPRGKGWFRASCGTVRSAPDGQRSITWTIPYPEPSTEFALCYPYGSVEWKGVLDKSKGFWRSDEIGFSRDGRLLQRVSNNYGGASGAKPLGLYVVAREYGGETPGSWVLDGMLRQLARAKRNPLAVWTIPFANLDSVESGSYGRGEGASDLGLAWGARAQRHEAVVIQQDVARWAAQTTPLLALTLGASAGAESEGVRMRRDQDEPEGLTKELSAWCNVLKSALPKGLAHDAFSYIDTAPVGSESSRFSSHVGAAHGVPALALEFPYGAVGPTVLTQKGYREMGAALAEAILVRAIQQGKR